MKRFYILFLLILITGYGFSQFPKYLYGTISYYGDEFKGKRTASGEIFDPNKYTAAHQSLPFGTEIMVENLENGRKVKLVINDRGPFVANRILDVSKRAAEELGFIRKGTTYAKITIIKVGEGKIVDENNSIEVSSQSVGEISYSSSSSLTPTTTTQTNPSSQTQKDNSLTQQTPPEMSITYTNVVIVSKTNEVTITNTVVIPVTNIIEIPPYEDKIVEKEVKKINTDEEFIISEPEEYASLPMYSSSSSVIVSSSSSQEITNFEIMEKEVVIDTSSSSSSYSVSKREDFYDKNLKFYIQVGAFKDEKNALKIYDQLRKENLPVFTIEEITKGNKWIKVRLGYYNSREDAEKTLKKIEKYKLQGIILVAK